MIKKLKEKINSLEEKVTSVGRAAFYNCMNLQSVSLPSTLKAVAASSFENSGVQSIKLGDKVTTIGDKAFKNCPNLREIYIYNPSCSIYSSNTTISNSVNGGFGGTIYGYSGSTAETYAKKYGYNFSVIPGSAPYTSSPQSSNTTVTTTSTSSKPKTTTTTKSVKPSTTTTTCQPSLNVRFKIKSMPSKLVYDIGEDLDFSGSSIYSAYDYVNEYGKKSVNANKEQPMDNELFKLDTSQYNKWNEGTYPIKVMYTVNYSGLTATGAASQKISLEELVKACGVSFVESVDPYDLTLLLAVLKEAKEKKGVKVIIAKQPCVIMNKRLGIKRSRYVVESDRCIKCGACIKYGCPAIETDVSGAAKTTALCTGCGVCADICPAGAIHKGGLKE